MSFYADLHIHSRFAGACSKQITLENLEKYAKIKGLNLLGTGDFTHPTWYKEIVNSLQEDENGILRSKSGFPFLWQTEISLIYTQGGKGRRVHHLVLAPTKYVVEQIIDLLGKRGRLDYEGRPIFGLSSIEFLEMMRSISKDIEIIPAHAWTPWFSIFGSRSGFDSIKECFQEKASHIHAIETGMSSDPQMNWRISMLDKTNLVSFSDMHSFWPWRIGREATIFEGPLAYKSIIHAIRTAEGLKGTIEVDPGYGKYHVDGHRVCGVSLTPKETQKYNGICPKCKKPLTIGVLSRVEQLADRPKDYVEKNRPSFTKIIPLTELIAAFYSISQLTSKKVWQTYNQLINALDSEFDVLLHASKEQLASIVDVKLAEVIIKNRQQQIEIRPGFDGVYGTPILSAAQKDSTKQRSISDFKIPL
ncbi:DNA helicase UvrD [Candidatus Woesearchaeota archaeon]|nr:DNA helicase UvrD [Candidatus Woesearchaeota archaeon]